MLALRYCKIALVFFIGVFACLVGWNNIADYGSNWMFVQHVMSMDTTFEGNALMGRAITNPTIQQLGYWGIIAAELATGVLCLIGSVLMLRSVRDLAALFNRSKTIAFYGLTLGFILWFFGFMTIGAEWFLMWQSQTWNGQDAAFRFIVCIGLVLLLVAMDDREAA
jgi:predicted small integral membrane protein